MPPSSGVAEQVSRSAGTNGGYHLNSSVRRLPQALGEGPVVGWRSWSAIQVRNLEWWVPDRRVIPVRLRNDPDQTDTSHVVEQLHIKAGSLSETSAILATHGVRQRKAWPRQLVAAWRSGRMAGQSDRINWIGISDADGAAGSQAQTTSYLEWQALLSGRPGRKRWVSRWRTISSMDASTWHIIYNDFENP